MFDMMKSSNKRDNDAIEGFGRSGTAPVVPDNLAKDASRTLCFTPMSGILKQKISSYQVLSFAIRVRIGFYCYGCA